jgi:alkylated DNA nucleotide flippase Atl1
MSKVHQPTICAVSEEQLPWWKVVKIHGTSHMSTDDRRDAVLAEVREIVQTQRQFEHPELN